MYFFCFFFTFQGNLYDSVSNLSSVWATTIPSIRASLEDLHIESNEDKIVECPSEEKCKHLRVQDWTDKIDQL